MEQFSHATALLTRQLNCFVNRAVAAMIDFNGEGSRLGAIPFAIIQIGDIAGREYDVVVVREDVFTFVVNAADRQAIRAGLRVVDTARGTLRVPRNNVVALHRVDVVANAC